MHEPVRVKASTEVRQTMVCLTLLILHLASCLATVQSSLTSHGTDQTLFVQQHRGHLQSSNQTCEDFVYKQTEQYLRTEFSGLQVAVERTALLLTQISEQLASEAGPFWVLSTFLEPSARDLVYRYEAVKEATVSLKTEVPKVGAKGHIGVVLFIRVLRVNGTLSVFRNWGQSCTVETSARAWTDVKVTSSVDCTSEIMDTVLLEGEQEEEKSVTRDNSTDFAWTKGGNWNVYCLDDTAPTSVTSADFLLGFNSFVPTQSNNSHALYFR